jgi:hypothetical protein
MAGGPHVEFLQSTELTIPLLQILLLLATSTLALLFGRIKLALLVNYIFTLYWGYVLNREALVGAELEQMDMFTTAYFGFGFFVVILAVLGFLSHRN